MDGVMFMHSQRLNAIKHALEQEKAIGDVKRINCMFSFNAPEEFRQSNIRTDSTLEPHGCLGDLGWYTIRFALWAMNGQMPSSVTGNMLSSLQRPGSPEPVPMEFSGELIFGENTSASFYVSFQTGMQQSATICGTDGQITIEDFVLPYFGNQIEFGISNAEFMVEGCEFRMEDHRQTRSVREYANGAQQAQETFLFQRMSEIVNTGQTESYFSDYALKTQSVLDACFASAKTDGQPVNPKVLSTV